MSISARQGRQQARPVRHPFRWKGSTRIGHPGQNCGPRFRRNYALPRPQPPHGHAPRQNHGQENKHGARLVQTMS